MPDYRDLYEQYIEGIGDANDKGWVRCKCVFHSDKHPSAAFNVLTGVFNCLACNNGDGKAWSPVAFLVEHAGLKWSEASTLVDQYRKDNGLVVRNDLTNKIITKLPRWEQLVKKAQSQLHPEIPLVIEYCKTRGLSYQVLEDAGVGFLKGEDTEWRKASLVFPYYHDGKVCGIRYRDCVGDKGAESKSTMTLWGMDQVSDDCKTVLIVEGETDRLRTLCAISQLGLIGTVDVVSTAGIMFPPEWLREFQNIERAILIPQSDTASQNLIHKVVSVLGNRAVVVPLPWKRRQIGNDIADWFRYNTSEDFHNLLKGVGGLYRNVSMTGHELEEQADKERPDSWLIHGLLGRQQSCIVAGPPKSRKTWMVLNIVKTILSPEIPLFGLSELVGPTKPGKVLIVEEEGTKRNLYDRACMVFRDVPHWKESVTWWHRRGVKLDDEYWIHELEVACENVDCLVLDPMQDLHVSDNENDASKMRPFWDGVRRLLMRFPHLAIVIIAHFGKAGTVEAGGKAIRGSDRSRGVIDLGIYIEERPKKDGPGILLAAEGREIEPFITPHGNNVFELRFTEDGLLLYETPKAKGPPGGVAVFLSKLKDKTLWNIEDAATELNVSSRTVLGWINKYLKQIVRLGDHGEIEYCGD